MPKPPSKSTGRPRETNRYWIIGPCAIMDVSTPANPRATTLIDATDLPALLDGQGKWSAHKDSRYPRLRYAKRTRRDIGKRIEMMHRVLRGSLQDHKNGDGLDNRSTNLRPATPAQNNANTSRSRTGYRGVYPRGGKWRAGISHGERAGSRSLGTFATDYEAARAYDAAARLRFGEFARLNFPEEP